MRCWKGRGWFDSILGIAWGKLFTPEIDTQAKGDEQLIPYSLHSKKRLRQVKMRTPVTGLIFVATIFGSQAAVAADNLDVVARQFVNDSIFGEYIDSRNWRRFWIDDSAVHVVAFEQTTRSTDPSEGLRTQQLVHGLVDIRADVDKTNIRAMLSKLRDKGVEAKCKINRIQLLSASASTGMAILRFPNSVADKILDMQISRPGRWEATYIAYRSLELARVGALPFSEKESELSKTLPLDDFPFTASTIVYRISNQRKPNIDWCMK